MNKKARRQLQH